MVPNASSSFTISRRRTYSRRATLTVSRLLRCLPRRFARSRRTSSMARLVGTKTSLHIPLCSRKRGKSCRARTRGRGRLLQVRDTFHPIPVGGGGGGAPPGLVVGARAPNGLDGAAACPPRVHVQR